MTIFRLSTQQKVGKKKSPIFAAQPSFYKLPCPASMERISAQKSCCHAGKSSGDSWLTSWRKWMAWAGAGTGFARAGLRIRPEIRAGLEWPGVGITDLGWQLESQAWVGS
ncbi:hypothetical protein TIFTF001_033589 [Ficus carica]|uniref:Uncharacterized protein n=1 Tax=Ficus carica TaxID=3494 RepID=A0AA88DYR9_FICCA|nr:hypothetical protein TIFTF001_033589 [Ficus carica]